MSVDGPLGFFPSAFKIFCFDIYFNNLIMMYFCMGSFLKKIMLIFFFFFFFECAGPSLLCGLLPSCGEGDIL